MIAACKTFASELQVPYGIFHPNRFKGRSFMRINFGSSTRWRGSSVPSRKLPPGISHYFHEPWQFTESGLNVTPYDSARDWIRANMKIDGAFQSERYIRDHKESLADEFQSTLKVSLSANSCVINVRGGEYRYVEHARLTSKYFRDAMEFMKSKVTDINFIVVTDDAKYAHWLLPELPIISHRKIPYIRQLNLSPTSTQIGMDFTFVQQAPFLILSNSTFSWWGAWTSKKVKLVVAPKYWQGFNSVEQVWSPRDALTRGEGWQWMDREGNVSSYQECAYELNRENLK